MTKVFKFYSYQTSVLFYFCLHCISTHGDNQKNHNTIVNNAYSNGSSNCINNRHNGMQLIILKSVLMRVMIIVLDNSNYIDNNPYNVVNDIKTNYDDNELEIRNLAQYLKT